MPGNRAQRDLQRLIAQPRPPWRLVGHAYWDSGHKGLAPQEKMPDGGCECPVQSLQQFTISLQPNQKIGIREVRSPGLNGTTPLAVRLRDILRRLVVALQISFAVHPDTHS